MSWSGGKDCALALDKILADPAFEVESLHTTIGIEKKRVGLHGVREELIEQQAENLGLPLTKLYLAPSTSNHKYEKVMSDFYRQCRDEHISGVVFGDIFLEDLKIYRETLLSKFSLDGIYPLWKQKTSSIVREFLERDFKSIICSADGKWFDEKVVGRMIDEEFLSSLPVGVDPCGENGEFHSFVFDGPIFRNPVRFVKGEVVKQVYEYDIVDSKGEKSRMTNPFWFIDLLPGDDKLVEAR